MESLTTFEQTDWDEKSGTSTLHLSYLIQLLLPVRHTGWTKEKYRKPFKIPQMDGIDHICLPTGSTAEGLNIPRCIIREPKTSNFEVFSDIDLLCVPNTIQISTMRDTKTTQNYDGYFDDENISPGYTRICVQNKAMPEEVLSFDNEREKYYLNSEKFLQGAYFNAKDDLLNKNKNTSTHGPALSVDEPEIVKFEGKFDQYAGVSQDIVLALPCHPWPPIADNWKERAKASQWLPPTLVESIIEDGCHVVGAQSKNSQYPDLEWRISFSASEGRLAREAVTDYQRQCYIFLKILRYEVMKPDPILSSYVFKSIFLHCCERLPFYYWKNRPANCVLYMLDVLLECLKRKHVPTYFVPENNLIKHLTDEEMGKAIAAVETLRNNPVTPILEFTDKKAFAYHCELVPFGLMVKPLLEDIESFSEHRDRHQSVQNGLLTTAVAICHLYMYECMEEKYIQFELRKHQEGIHTLIHFYIHWLKPLQGNVLPMTYFLTSVALEMEDSRLSVAFYEAVVSLGDTFPELLVLKGNLASMCHVHAYTLTSADERTAYLRKAEILFQELYNDGVQSVIDYATYLIKENQCEKAQLIIEDFLLNGDEKSNIIYSYTENEMAIVDERLKKHIQSHVPVSGEALSFAYFYLVKCMCTIDQPLNESKVAAVLEKLKSQSAIDSAACCFDFYAEAKKMTIEHIKRQPLVSSATTCMLMVTVPAMLITFLVKTLNRDN